MSPDPAKPTVPAGAPGTLAPGQRIADRYALERRIAVGGMGEVWEASDERLGRSVAVKVLRAELSDDPEFLHRFRIEARTVASLNHSGVAAVHDYGEDQTEDGRRTAYLVMELVRGEPLSAVIARGPLEPAETLRVLEQAAHALHAAHERGFVHRDVKPGNILVRVDGVVKLTDFGIAKAANAVPVTRTGMVMGTAHYIAPEQASGGEAGPEGDVYSLGIVGYECLAGHRPFRAENAVAVAMMQVRDEPPPLSDTVPAPVRALIDAVLVKDPDRRYADGAEFAAAVAAVRRGENPPTPARLAAQRGALPAAEPGPDPGPAEGTPRTVRQIAEKLGVPGPEGASAGPGPDAADPPRSPRRRRKRRRGLRTEPSPTPTDGTSGTSSGGTGTPSPSPPSPRSSPTTAGSPATGVSPAGSPAAAPPGGTGTGSPPVAPATGSGAGPARARDREDDAAPGTGEGAADTRKPGDEPAPGDATTATPRPGGGARTGSRPVTPRPRPAKADAATTSDSGDAPESDAERTVTVRGRDPSPAPAPRSREQDGTGPAESARKAGSPTATATPPPRPPVAVTPPAPPTEPLKLVPKRSNSGLLIALFVLLTIAAVALAVLALPRLFTGAAGPSPVEEGHPAGVTAAGPATGSVSALTVPPPAAASGAAPAAPLVPAGAR